MTRVASLAIYPMGHQAWSSRVVSSHSPERGPDSVWDSVAGSAKRAMFREKSVAIRFNHIDAGRSQQMIFSYSFPAPGDLDIISQ